MASQLLATKPFGVIMEEAEDTGEHSLRRALGPVNLITLGHRRDHRRRHFRAYRQAAATTAGPAIVLSFILSGIICAFAGLCYAEFASLIPIAGSAYTYGYATLGEIFAWIIGWDLILEYAFGAATVASGWSGYFISLMDDLGIRIPPAVDRAPREPSWSFIKAIGMSWSNATPVAERRRDRSGNPATRDRSFQFGRFSRDRRGHAYFGGRNQGIGQSQFRDRDCQSRDRTGLHRHCRRISCSAIPRWHRRTGIPSSRPIRGKFGEFGWSGVARGAAVIFFAYIGFDAVSTAAQEAKNPQKDMPIGIIGSLVICTVLYILVSGLLTAVVGYSQLNVSDPVAIGIDATGVRWGSLLVKAGAVAGLGSVMLVMLLGQSRVFYSMSRDGLLPPWAGAIHPRFRTPWISSIVVGICVAFFAAVIPIGDLAVLVNIGTLLAFVIVCAGVWVLRRKRPDLPRPFKTPLVPLVPILGILTSLAAMLSLPAKTWWRLLIWLAIGLLVYAFYGRSHSRVREALRHEN